MHPHPLDGPTQLRDQTGCLSHAIMWTGHRYFRAPASFSKSSCGLSLLIHPASSRHNTMSQVCLQNLNFKSPIQTCIFQKWILSISLRSRLVNNSIKVCKAGSFRMIIKSTRQRHTAKSGACTAGDKYSTRTVSGHCRSSWEEILHQLDRSGRLAPDTIC